MDIGLQDIVRVKSRDRRIGTVRDIDFDETGEKLLVQFFGPESVNVPRDDLEATGLFEAPIRFYEVVEVVRVNDPDDEDAAAIVGDRAVVTGMGCFDDGSGFIYDVEADGGGSAYLRYDEVKQTGIIITEEMLYGPRDRWKTLKVRVDRETGVGTIVEGTAPSDEETARKKRFTLDLWALEQKNYSKGD